MKNIRNMFLMVGILACAAQAEDDILSGWVVMPVGDLKFKNDTTKEINVVYKVPTAQGITQGSIKIAPKAELAFAVSAYQLFRSDLALIWNEFDLAISARKYLGESFTKNYGVQFRCAQGCCSVICQSEYLIRAFLTQGKRFTTELEKYKKSLTGTKVRYLFSSDAKGIKVTLKIGNWSSVIHP